MMTKEECKHIGRLMCGDMYAVLDFVVKTSFKDEDGNDPLSVQEAIWILNGAQEMLPSYRPGPGQNPDTPLILSISLLMAVIHSDELYEAYSASKLLKLSHGRK